MMRCLIRFCLSRERGRFKEKKEKVPTKKAIEKAAAKAADKKAVEDATTKAATGAAKYWSY